MPFTSILTSSGEKLKNLMSKTSPKVTPSKGEAEEDGAGRDSNELIEIVSKEISEEEF